jgi:hypothetical protein
VLGAPPMLVGGADLLAESLVARARAVQGTDPCAALTCLERALAIEPAREAALQAQVQVRRPRLAAT